MGSTGFNLTKALSFSMLKTSIAHPPFMTSMAVDVTPSFLLANVCLYAKKIKPTMAKGINKI
jgi:hypothetical protein